MGDSHVTLQSAPPSTRIQKKKKMTETRSRPSRPSPLVASPPSTSRTASASTGTGAGSFRACVALLLLVNVASKCGDALAPSLVDTWPLLLIALNANDLHLALTAGAGRVGLAPYCIVGIARRLLEDPLYMYLGWTYGTKAVDWLEVWTTLIGSLLPQFIGPAEVVARGGAFCGLYRLYFFFFFFFSQNSPLPSHLNTSHLSHAGVMRGRERERQRNEWRQPRNLLLPSRTCARLAALARRR